jgi:hypothetical protein
VDDPLDRPTIKPFEDADQDPPVPVGEPSRTTEEAARGDLAIRGAATGGALSGSAGYAGGALTGTGGAIGGRLADAEPAPDVEDELAPGTRPESDAGVSAGPPDEPGIDPPASAAERTVRVDPDA